MDTFLNLYDLPKLNQEDVNKPIYDKQWDCSSNGLQTKTPGLDEFYQIIKDKLRPMFHKTERKEQSQTHLTMLVLHWYQNWMRTQQGKNSIHQFPWWT
jgi:hypothetical protein